MLILILLNNKIQYAFHVQIRGDPDGCGLDISGIRYSPTSELRVDLPAEDLLNIKKGWLMKQGLNKVRLAYSAIREVEETCTF